MKYEELELGRKYRTTAKDAPVVKYVGTEATYEEGKALVNVLYRGRIYLMGANQLICEVQGRVT